MKTKTIRHGFQNTALFTACLLLAGGALQAESHKDKDGKGNGKPEHSEKEKGEGNRKHKGKSGKDDDSNGAKNDRKDDDKRDNQNAEWRKKSFRNDDRTGVIRYFADFRDNDRGLPPGLAKNYLRGKPLPTGWQTKVRSGYVIVDDDRDFFYPLEYSLFPGLEIVADTRLYLYGNRIVRVYEPRREVIDVIEVSTIRFE